MEDIAVSLFARQVMFMTKGVGAIRWDLVFSFTVAMGFGKAHFILVMMVRHQGRQKHQKSDKSEHCSR